MRTNTEIRNQQAINEFFDAFGTDTTKEYSEAFFDLVILLGENQKLSSSRREDLTTKLKDLNRLVTQLGSLENVNSSLENAYQKN